MNDKYWKMTGREFENRFPALFIINDGKKLLVKIGDIVLGYVMKIFVVLYETIPYLCK